MKTKYRHFAVLTASTLGLTGLSFASGFGDEKYVYDASGNIVEKQIGDQVTRYDYTGNQLNGSASASSRKQYAYDASGRITSDSEAGKPTSNMEHQYLDKVTKVQNGDKTTELFYNAEGQLVATNSAGTSETFAWDGLAMVSRGEQLYVNEAHAVGGVPAIVGNDVAVSDMIGSSLSVGNKKFDSTVYGEGLVEGLFTGKPFIKDLDGFLFLFRTYSAGNARWQTADPSGYPDGDNNFAYVDGDALTSVDPNGLAMRRTNSTPKPGRLWNKTNTCAGEGSPAEFKAQGVKVSFYNSNGSITSSTVIYDENNIPSANEAIVTEGEEYQADYYVQPGGKNADAGATDPISFLGIGVGTPAYSCGGNTIQIPLAIGDDIDVTVFEK